MHAEHVPLTELHHHLGARLVAEDRAIFQVWAPDHARVRIELVDRNRLVEMSQTTSGYHVAEIDAVTAGDRYSYRLSDGPPRPDPVSRFQPAGVHGPSQIIDTSFAWSDDQWRPPSVRDLVIYEAHVGSLTPAGTFLSAITCLDELVDLGVTAIELMPVAQCPGKWNWGYDGVNLFAPNHNYGTPDELRRFVDAAHAKNLAVLLDVVYNHLGPEGNYLSEFGPYFSSRHATPWGAAPNLDDPNNAHEVRRFIIANAIYWLDEFHIDGLRVDAIHCIHDTSQTHLVAEMAEAIRAWSGKSGRDALLIAESNVYDPQMLVGRHDDGIGFDAQWCDDLLHSVSAIVRPNDQLCHRVYRAGTDLDQTLRMGYVYEGTLKDQRGRRPLGPRVDTSELVYSIQQHDFVGNHPQGKRFHQLTSTQAQAAAAVLLFLSPGIPMMFMGEEFACEHPFRFFVDFGDPALRQAVTAGRQREYPQHDWDNGLLATDPRTFQESKIGPREKGDLNLWHWYRSLIALRQRLITSGLIRDTNLTVDTNLSDGIFILRYTGDTESATAIVRLSVSDNHDPADWTHVGSRHVNGNLWLDSRRRETPQHMILPNHAKVFLHDLGTAAH